MFETKLFSNLSFTYMLKQSCLVHPKGWTCYWLCSTELMNEPVSIEVNLSFYLCICVNMFVCHKWEKTILITVTGKKLILQKSPRNQLFLFYYRTHGHQKVQWQWSLPDWSTLTSEIQIPAYGMIGIVHSLKNFASELIKRLVWLRSQQFSIHYFK